MIRSNLVDYSDAYIPAKGTIRVPNTGTAAALDNINKKVIFQNCASFTNCISEINNTKVDDAHNIDVVMTMFNFIEYIDNYSNTSGSLRKYYRDKSTLDGTNNFIDFPADNNNRISIKEKITVKPGNNGTKD